MHFLSCTWKAQHGTSYGPVSRVLPGGRPGEAATVQTLVACGLELRPLIGADALGGLELGPPLQLYADPAARDGEPAAARRPYEPLVGLRYPAWDPHSAAVYLLEGRAVVRLTSDNTVTVVAGSVVEQGDTDGPGRAARFSYPEYLVSDGAGSLYVADEGRVRKLQLPGVGPGAGAVGAAHAGAPSAAAQAAAAEAAAAAGGEALVSTLLQNLPGSIWGLAHDDGRCSSGSGSLLFATARVLYRLPLGNPTAAPLLLAGCEGVRAAVDGVGAGARFRALHGIVVDGEGSAYVADWAGPSTSLRRVAVDGTVSTVVTGLPQQLDTPTILPNGFVTMSSISPGEFHVLCLGLKLPACHAAAAQLLPPAATPTGPQPRTLPADLGALLDRQPDGTADVTIVVGGRTFHAHRVLLSARSDYFQQRFSSGFAEGSAQELSLPDADPDAFELWLRFIYMGAVDIPAALAAAVVELADRLLLPELREQAAGVVEASVSASTVAGLLLWAEARGPAFAELLSRLKAWFMANHEAVMREGGEEVGLLAERRPRLFYELMRDSMSQPAKRPRNH